MSGLAAGAIVGKLLSFFHVFSPSLSGAVFPGWLRTVPPNQERRKMANSEVLG
jgi:hypothetical protein